MENVLIDIRKESRQLQRIFAGKDLVSIEDLLAVIEEQDDEIEHIQDEFKQYKEMVEEDYKPIYKDDYDRYGVSKNDFF